MKICQRGFKNVWDNSNLWHRLFCLYPGSMWMLYIDNWWVIVWKSYFFLLCLIVTLFWHLIETHQMDGKLNYRHIQLVFTTPLSMRDSTHCYCVLFILVAIKYVILLIRWCHVELNWRLLLVLLHLRVLICIYFAQLLNSIWAVH